MEINSQLSTHGLSGLGINQAGVALTAVYLQCGKLTLDQQAVLIQVECGMIVCQTGSLQSSELCEGISESLCRLRGQHAESAVMIRLQKEHRRE